MRRPRGTSVKFLLHVGLVLNAKLLEGMPAMLPRCFLMGRITLADPPCIVVHRLGVN